VGPGLPSPKLWLILGSTWDSNPRGEVAPLINTVTGGNHVADKRRKKVTYRVEVQSETFGDWSSEMIGGKSENTFDSREKAEEAMKCLKGLERFENADLRIVEE